MGQQYNKIERFKINCPDQFFLHLDEQVFYVNGQQYNKIERFKINCLDQFFLHLDEQVFYVNGAKKQDLCTVVRMKPRNLFAMLESANSENEGRIDLDSLDVGLEDMCVSGSDEVLMNLRSNMEGITGDVSVIHVVLSPSPQKIKM